MNHDAKPLTITYLVVNSLVTVIGLVSLLLFIKFNECLANSTMLLGCLYFGGHVYINAYCVFYLKYLNRTNSEICDNVGLMGCHFVVIIIHISAFIASIIQFKNNYQCFIDYNQGFLIGTLLYMSFPVIIILAKFCRPSKIMTKIKNHKTKMYMKSIEEARLKDIGKRPMCQRMSEETNLSARPKDYGINQPHIQTPSTGVKIIVIDTTENQEEIKEQEN